MKTQLMVVPLTIILTLTSLSACSNNAPRITPGYLETSHHVKLHTAKISNIVQLSEKEAPLGKVLLGTIVGGIAGAELAKDESDVTKFIAEDLGSDIGKDLVTSRHGKTIYKLTLVLDDRSVKQIHVRGGVYVVGRQVKVTVNNSSGKITSLLALKA